MTKKQNCDCKKTNRNVGCLPIKKWRVKCPFVCFSSQVEEPQSTGCGCGCECACGCGVNEPEIVNDIPEEDVEVELSEKTLAKKNGSPFKRGKALIIGINYTGTDSELRGCINDAINMYAYLTMVEKFDPALIRVLTDDPNSDIHHLPTRKNIISGIRWLVNENPMGDNEDPFSLFMHYSGHGSWVWDLNKDEIDRKDETICPLDYHDAGMIVDDELRQEIVTPLKDASNIHVTCVFDCCHSGTILDMRYNVRVKLNKTRPDYSQIVVSEDKTYEKSQCRVTVFSGCMDKQYSADAYIERQSQGFMTWALLYTLKKLQKDKRKCTYKKIITDLQSLANTKGYDQIPQLTYNKYIDLKERFTI